MARGVCAESTRVSGTVDLGLMPESVCKGTSVEWPRAGEDEG